MHAHAGSPSHIMAADPRTVTSLEEIDSTIIKPGSVKINVKGAFIVDPDMATPSNGNGNGRGSPTHHETSDIRLPNHTAVVSHIAIDVRFFCYISGALNCCSKLTHNRLAAL